MSDSRPNVLFICVDQWPADLLGCAGHPVIETPTLDRLAELGTRYTRCYAETPICIPSRRSIMTGASSRLHGDREFQPSLPMPKDLPTLPQCFKDNGYQTAMTGKLHVYPTRDRIGFEEAWLAEEGRGQIDGPDDYEIYLADSGCVGQQFLHGMSNNEYEWRPWHLPEHTHVTSWTTTTAARMIKRRDPTRPGFWYVSYTAPHPPLVPLASYLERYRDRDMPVPTGSEWSRDTENLPYVLRAVQEYWRDLAPVQHANMLRAFYALCTHIDHQIRVLIGTLREEGLLDNTIICFTGDHGDMLGDHGFYAKRLMYEGSARVPFMLIDKRDGGRVTPGATDDRLMGLQDIMPSLLELAGLPMPEGGDGRSAVNGERRHTFYGEASAGVRATRMIRDERYKLIWYPAGNHFQLFDLQEDPLEEVDRIDDPDHVDIVERLKGSLLEHLYGEDLEWIRDGQLVGTEAPAHQPHHNRGLSGQRGLHYPEPPRTDPSKPVGSW
ncbi:sulfatase-like hydrolase/transferase [Kushneria indalinina]|uniref:Arylsulfatase A-like enzyme n=1 Tax=Kushneria indalinina DSM 14324 TaxID=1122140 RepID=A0A3D9DUG8_9GAMM|nr:sulfatase-like hydrolase/transferase [Kushneria indalinina]REC94377.1 arylsulfatase A-like enzyme [Kushneria indalinina DSM 14324]